MTPEDRRYDDEPFPGAWGEPCSRCGGAFYYWGDKDSDAGWIKASVPPEEDVFICPNCQTAEESRAEAEAEIEDVEKGQAVSAEEGREYPADLAEAAEAQKRWLRREAAERAELERHFREDG